MKAICSILAGTIAIVIILGMQANLLLLIRLHKAEKVISPAVYSIGFGTKTGVILLGIIAIFCSILYSKSNQRKLKMINRIGLFFGILAIILCFIPLYYFA